MPFGDVNGQRIAYDDTGEMGPPSCSPMAS